MKRLILHVLPLAGILLVGGCATDDGGGDEEVVEGTAAPTTPTAESPAVESPAAGGVGGEIGRADGTYAAGPAGSVVLRIEDGRLVLETVSPTSGWDYSIDERDDDEVELTFRGPDGSRVDFEAELEDDGTLDIDVSERHALRDGTITVELPEDAGSVTFSVAGDTLPLDDVSPAEGWQAREEERDDDEFEVELRHDDRQLKIELEVEIDDDRLEIETETRYGPGFVSGDDDNQDNNDDDDDDDDD